MSQEIAKITKNFPFELPIFVFVSAEFQRRSKIPLDLSHLYNLRNLWFAFFSLVSQVSSKYPDGLCDLAISCDSSTKSVVSTL